MTKRELEETHLIEELIQQWSETPTREEISLLNSHENFNEGKITIEGSPEGLRNFICELLITYQETKIRDDKSSFYLFEEWKWINGDFTIESYEKCAQSDDPLPTTHPFIKQMQNIGCMLLFILLLATTIYGAISIIRLFFQ